MDDLEELKIKNSKIYSLGKKTYDLKSIDGRFLGITKFSKKMTNDLKKNLISKILRQNKNIDFTNFLMQLINKNFKVKPSLVSLIGTSLTILKILKFLKNKKICLKF